MANPAGRRMMAEIDGDFVVFLIGATLQPLPSAQDGPGPRRQARHEAHARLPGRTPGQGPARLPDGAAHHRAVLALLRPPRGVRERRRRPARGRVAQLLAPGRHQRQDRDLARDVPGPRGRVRGDLREHAAVRAWQQRAGWSLATGKTARQRFRTAARAGTSARNRSATAAMPASMARSPVSPKPSTSCGGAGTRTARKGAIPYRPTDRRRASATTASSSALSGRCATAWEAGRQAGEPNVGGVALQRVDQRGPSPRVHPAHLAQVPVVATRPEQGGQRELVQTGGAPVETAASPLRPRWTARAGRGPSPAGPRAPATC